MKERTKYQWIRRHNQEATQFSYSQLLLLFLGFFFVCLFVCFKFQKELNERRIIFSTNGDGALIYP